MTAEIIIKRNPVIIRNKTNFDKYFRLLIQKIIKCFYIDLAIILLIIALGSLYYLNIPGISNTIGLMGVFTFFLLAFVAFILFAFSYPILYYSQFSLSNILSSILIEQFLFLLAIFLIRCLDKNFNSLKIAPESVSVKKFLFFNKKRTFVNGDFL